MIQTYEGYRVTDTVYIVATRQEAAITAVILTPGRIMYEVRYWLDGESITVTLEAFELTDAKPSMRLGSDIKEHITPQSLDDSSRGYG